MNVKNNLGDLSQSDFTGIFVSNLEGPGILNNYLKRAANVFSKSDNSLGVGTSPLCPSPSCLAEGGAQPFHIQRKYK